MPVYAFEADILVRVYGIISASDPEEARLLLYRYSSEDLLDDYTINSAYIEDISVDDDPVEEEGDLP